MCLPPCGPAGFGVGAPERAGSNAINKGPKIVPHRSRVLALQSSPRQPGWCTRLLVNRLLLVSGSLLLYTFRAGGMSSAIAATVAFPPAGKTPAHETPAETD